MSLANGLTVNCAAGGCSAGTPRFWASLTDDVDSVNYVAGEIDTITMQVGGVFKEFNPYQETCKFDEEGVVDQCNSVFTQNLTGIYPCRSKEARLVFEELKSACCGLVIIHQEADGGLWIWGLSQKHTSQLTLGYPATLKTTSSTTGAALGDKNQLSFVIEARASYEAIPLEATVTVPV